MKKHRIKLEYALIQIALWGCAAFIFIVLPNAALVLPAAGLVSVLLILAWRFPAETQKAAGFCFRYRWALALLVFLLCMGLRLHGSFIGVYDEVFPIMMD